MAEEEDSTKVWSSVIPYLGMRFVVSGTPMEDTLSAYCEHWKSLNVVRVVRMTEKPSYEASHSSVPVVDIPFPDGKTPDKESIKKWLDVVVEVYGPPAKQKKEFGKKETPEDAPAIAVHCIAGLGRSPLLVAIALIEYGYGKPLEVISYIRSKRKNAINAPQMEFLKKYKRTLKSSCTIM